MGNPTRREQALADPTLPPVLKDLAERIVPQKLQDELRYLVMSGALDPLMVCEAQPLLSPVSQMFAAEDPVAWLKILFSQAPEKMPEAICPCTGYRNGRFSTDPNVYDYYYNSDVEKPLLLAVLATRTETPVVDLARIDPAMLGAGVPDRYGNNAGQPLLHQLLENREFSVATFDKLETLTGSTDFLFIKNARGETLFHRIVSQPSAGEDLNKLDIASWMLQRQAELINEPDRFGWTPLDRLLSQAQGKLDTSMGRLLIVSGARLEKQMAPQFNLAAALEERSGARLDKPAPRKTGGLVKGL